jgi:hypothetical protein
VRNNGSVSAGSLCLSMNREDVGHSAFTGQ